MTLLRHRNQDSSLAWLEIRFPYDMNSGQPIIAKLWVDEKSRGEKVGWQLKRCWDDGKWHGFRTNLNTRNWWTANDDGRLIWKEVWEIVGSSWSSWSVFQMSFTLGRPKDHTTFRESATKWLNQRSAVDNCKNMPFLGNKSFIRLTSRPINSLHNICCLQITVIR